MLDKTKAKLERKRKRLPVIPYTRIGDSKQSTLNKIKRKEKAVKYQLEY